MGNCFSGQKESTTTTTTSNNKGDVAVSTTTTNNNNTTNTTTNKNAASSEQQSSTATAVVAVEERSKTSNVEKKATTTVVAAASATSNFDEATNSFILKPAIISKFIIGPKGSTIKQLQEETSSKINVKDVDNDSKQIIIESANPKSCYERIMAELKKYGWEFDAKENQFVEHETEAMKLFKELEKKISEESKQMSDCFERAKKAYESGDGALSKQLSEEGKKHQELMKKYQQESAKTMFEHLNKDKGDLEIDLHGQYVDNAMEFLKNRIEKLRSKKEPKLTIIYGAGNHSDEKGPKIKPAVLEYLKNEGITFEEINHGSISANI